MRTTTRQRSNRVTTQEKILLPVHCFKMDMVLLFVDNFLFFRKSSTFLHAFVNMTESKANDNETFNSAVRSITYIKRELI